MQFFYYYFFSFSKSLDCTFFRQTITDSKKKKFRRFKASAQKNYA